MLSHFFNISFMKILGPKGPLKGFKSKVRSEKPSKAHADDKVRGASRWPYLIGLSH